MSITWIEKIVIGLLLFCLLLIVLSAWASVLDRADFMNECVKESTKTKCEVMYSEIEANRAKGQPQQIILWRM